jgi:lipopolysaccharide/colanic/teichoic acid biosynthesis glycosyltransferase
MMQSGEWAIDVDLFEGDTTVKMSATGRSQQPVPSKLVAPPSNYFRKKVWPVKMIGALMLVVASPAILFLIILVRLTSAGPGLYRQARTGRNGVTFWMYKIRTMYNDAEAVSGPVWCKPGDSRITPIGKILRLLHLDELPQLINVARGEMDLIGPRPERPEIVSQLARVIPNYYARLRILPGVTGLAQINLPPDESTECVRRKLMLDCAYICEATLLLDVRILACTFLRMFGIRHGRAATWLGVNRHANVPANNSSKPAEATPSREFPPFDSALASNGNGHAEFSAFATPELEGEESACVSEINSSGDHSSLLTSRPR